MGSLKSNVMRRSANKHEIVFGNDLKNVPRSIDSDSCLQLPEFLVRCIQKIDTMISTIGVYRINGDVAAVQKIRYSF